MKDVRERYTDVSDDDFESDLEIKRQGRFMKEENLDELAASMYDFLYGSDYNINLDNLF